MEGKVFKEVFFNLSKESANASNYYLNLYVKPPSEHFYIITIMNYN